MSRPTPFRAPVQRTKPASVNKRPSIDRVITSSNNFDRDISSENLLQTLLNNEKTEMKKEKPKTRPQAISTDRFRPASRPQAIQQRPAPVPENRPPPVPQASIQSNPGSRVRNRPQGSQAFIPNRFAPRPAPTTTIATTTGIVIFYKY